MHYITFYFFRQYFHKKFLCPDIPMTDVHQILQNTRRCNGTLFSKEGKEQITDVILNLRDDCHRPLHQRRAIFRRAWRPRHAAALSI